MKVWCVCCGGVCVCVCAHTHSECGHVCARVCVYKLDDVKDLVLVFHCWRQSLLLIPHAPGWLAQELPGAFLSLLPPISPQENWTYALSCPGLHWFEDLTSDPPALGQALFPNSDLIFFQQGSQPHPNNDSVRQLARPGAWKNRIYTWK